MVRIFALVHVFYPDCWERLRKALESIPADSMDLAVSLVGEHPRIEEDILRFAPQAKIERVANIGWDVWPFLKILSSVRLDDYDYVVKLHSKRDYPMTRFVNGFSVRGKRWREYLLNFLDSGERFSRCVEAFESDADLGMVADYRITREADKRNEESFALDVGLFRRAGIEQQPYAFVAGTMFMVRAKLLAPLLAMNWLEEEFGEPDRSMQRGPAHSIERFLGALVYAQGYRIADPFTPQWWQRISKPLAAVTGALSRFFYQDAVTASGHYIVKVCKVPVWRRKA